MRSAWTILIYFGKDINIGISSVGYHKFLLLNNFICKCEFIIFRNILCYCLDYMDIKPILPSKLRRHSVLSLLPHNFCQLKLSNGNGLKFGM